MTDAFAVSAPATSGNLGPGFDCLGLAFELRNQLHVTPGTGRVTVAGEGAGTVSEGDDNLVARAFDAVAPGLRADWDLHCTNAIPLARGLGSSTAATAVGALAGWHAAGIEPTGDALLQVLSDADGHADNAAPCVFGGLQVARRGVRVWETHALPFPTGLQPVVLVPGRELATSAARAAIPNTIDHATATRAVGTASALVACLAAGDLDSALGLLEADELHEPFRAVLVPELAAARSVLSQLGCPVTLSGAGPTVLAWARPAHVAAVTAALHEIAAPGDTVRVLDVTRRGACVEQA